jgi:hypothetical protein
LVQLNLPGNFEGVGYTPKPEDEHQFKQWVDSLRIRGHFDAVSIKQPCDKHGRHTHNRPIFMVPNGRLERLFSTYWRRNADLRCHSIKPRGRGAQLRGPNCGWDHEHSWLDRNGSETFLTVTAISVSLKSSCTLSSFRRTTRSRTLPPSRRHMEES